MGEGLSIEKIDNTFKDVVVTYTPSYNVVSYSYTIIKDGIYQNPVYVEGNNPSNIVFNSTGVYKIEITNYNTFGSEILYSGEYIIDKEAPIINIENKTHKIKTNEEFDFMNGVTASDSVDGDLTSAITNNINSLDFSSEGIKTIEYSVSDKAGNITTNKAYVTVLKDNTNLIRLSQITIISILVITMLFLYKYIKSIKIEKRFSKYTINSSKNDSISLFDSLYNSYLKFIDKFSSLLSKSVFLLNKSKRYSKYNSSFNLNDDNNMKFMSKKFIIGFIYILVTFIVKLAQSLMIEPYEILISFIIGFYTLDIIYIYKYMKYKKDIENEMLDAITVMNNGFKAGMSIIQAVNLVSKELDGPISKEFEKISMELSFGLDVEVAFKRFADRIKIDEAVYLTSSLSVLNKTGGNIIKVFDSIEKTLFNRKKLQNEFNALTSSSKFIMYVLIFVPIVFVIFISIINREYFNVLFTNPIGIALIVIMLLIYITYIIVVKRVMKVRM